MLFADLALARRLEAAEGYACAQFALARRRLFPESGSEAIRVAATDVVYDGPDSPVAQTFGLGLFEEASANALEAMERFFAERGAGTSHEVSPFAGAATLQLLVSRGYQPIEISNVLYRTLDEVPLRTGAGVTVRVIQADEAQLWTEINTRGWTHEHPEFEDFMRQTGGLLTARSGSVCFLGELNGTPAAAAALSLHQGVALLA